MAGREEQTGWPGNRPATLPPRQLEGSTASLPPTISTPRYAYNTLPPYPSVRELPLDPAILAQYQPRYPPFASSLQFERPGAIVSNEMPSIISTPCSSENLRLLNELLVARRSLEAAEREKEEQSAKIEQLSMRCEVFEVLRAGSSPDITRLQKVVLNLTTEGTQLKEELKRQQQVEVGLRDEMAKTKDAVKDDEIARLREAEKVLKHDKTELQKRITQMECDWRSIERELAGLRAKLKEHEDKEKEKAKEDARLAESKLLRGNNDGCPAELLDFRRKRAGETAEVGAYGRKQRKLNDQSHEHFNGVGVDSRQIVDLTNDSHTHDRADSHHPIEDPASPRSAANESEFRSAIAASYKPHEESETLRHENASLQKENNRLSEQISQMTSQSARSDITKPTNSAYNLRSKAKDSQERVAKRVGEGSIPSNHISSFGTPVKKLNANNSRLTKAKDKEVPSITASVQKAKANAAANEELALEKKMVDEQPDQYAAATLMALRRSSPFYKDCSLRKILQ